MVFTELLYNLALILVMGVLYSFIYRKLEYDSLMFKGASGLLFGVIALLGMNLSFTLIPGIIFDGRSVILSVAGLFGGLVPALIASVMAAFYRAWIGGGGVTMGVLVIISSAGLGVAYNVLRRRRSIPYRIHHFYLFGLLVHINMVILMATLPGAFRLMVFQKIALPVLALFPIATVIICMLLADTERRIKDEKALKESERRLRSIIAGMPVMLNAYDENGTIIAWNAECAAVTGYNTEEIIGKPEATALLYGNGADTMPVPQSSTGKAVIRNSERRITAKNGTVKTLLWSSLSDVFPIPGWHSWGIGVDITERKIHEGRIEAALREKEVLLKEIHHRVKNNMQIMSSLFNLQIRKMDDEKSRELVADTVRRIQSMALVHEMLNHYADLAEIDFKQYTARLVSEISGAYSAGPRGIRITMDLDELSLPLDTAIPCAMIINEIIMNSLKHAFPDGREGRVEISLKGRDTGRCVLTVRDDGVGLPEGPEKDDTALGMQMIRALTEQLGGRVTVSSQRGTLIAVDFPCGLQGPGRALA